MGSLCAYAETELMDHLIGNAFSQPTLYIALSTTDFTNAGDSGTEPVGNGYIREAHAAWDAATARATENTGVITFETASGAWGDIEYWAIFDQEALGGNCIAFGAFDVAKGIVDGNTATIADAEIVVSVDASASGGGWTDVLVHFMLDHVFEGTSYTSPSHFLALSTTTPTDDGPNFTEHAGDNYAREEITAFDAAAAGASENTNLVTMNVPSASWGLCTHLGCYSLVTGGVLLYWGDMTDQTPTTDDTVTVAAGALDLTLT